MAKIDATQFCNRMGWRISSYAGDDIVLWCPDHHLFTDRQPSDPKFYMNIKTGETFCHTEGRGSNLVYTIARLRGCDYDEASNFILGKNSDDEVSIRDAMQQHLGSQIHAEDPQAGDTEVMDLFRVKDEIAQRKTSPEAYNYFMYPPNKKPTLIEPATVDYFKAFERSYGYYQQRAILPSFYRGELTGYTAIDYLGKEKWLQVHQEPDEKKYKKVLYPKGFKSGRNLFGFDEVEEGAEYIILVEGPRDMMKLWQLGFKNCVSIYGTNLTLCHNRMLTEKYPQKIIIALDGDDAGISASEKIAQRLVAFFQTYIAISPRGHDPKTLVKKEITRILENSKKWFDVTGKRSMIRESRNGNFTR